MNTYFWFSVGALSGIAAAFVIVPLLRGAAGSVPRRARHVALAALALVMIVGSARLLYGILGEPRAIDTSAASAGLAHPGATAPDGGTPGESVEGAAARLEARIGQQGGTRGDWLLLAQSYDFLGRAEEAERARANAERAPETMAAAGSEPAAAATPSIVRAAADVASLQARVARAPRDAAAWLALANAHRLARTPDKASEAYRRVETLGAMTADSWADYADVLGSLAGGSLDGKAASAIDRALAIDADHPKALWLKASLAHQRKQYSAALTWWRKLRSVLPADSPDARIIELNIGEAEQLVKSQGGAIVAQEKTQDAHVTGTVSLDQKLSGRVAPGATLFIYAKAVDSPGPPLAVLRTSASAWPVSFRLDDSLSMLPTRKLSSFDQVVIEARISRSGQATPTPGDFYVVSPVVRPAERRPLQLVIARELS